MELRTTIALLLFTAPALAQLRINEVLVDPVGPNAGQQIVEIQNTGAVPFTAPIDWTFCVRPLYPAVPQITIPPGAIVRVHVGAVGVDTVTDWFLPFVPGIQNDGEFAIYKTNLFFADPTLLLDYVSWGAGAPALSSRIVTAVAAGIWPDPLVHLPLPAEGEALAWLGEGFGPDAYYVDTTPTIGAPNVPASYELFGVGCAGSVGIPDLHAVVAGARPWLGSPYALEVTNVATPLVGGILIISLTETPPSPLAGVGMPGCMGYLTPDATAFAVGSGVLPFSLALPLDPVLEGAGFVTQALVIDPGVNALGAVMSNAGRGIAGLQ